MITADEGFEG